MRVYGVGWLTVACALALGLIGAVERVGVTSGAGDGESSRHGKISRYDIKR